jgi:hypothetical protein
MLIGTTFTGATSWLGPEQLERQRAGVVDQHLLAGDDVELAGNQVVDEVPGQVQVAGNGGSGGDAPAFVGVAVFGRGAHGEGGHLVEEEVQPVVVVEHTPRCRA